MQICLESYITAGVGVLALMLGDYLNRKIPFLRRVCIPSPVSGGLLISLLTLLLYVIFDLEVAFDGTLKDICMMLFFTSVGFQSDFRQIRKGGRPLLVMTTLVAVLIIAQNILALSLAGAVGAEPLVGMATGSITMCGGHGTAGGFSSLLESLGLRGASSISMAAATFGMVAGSLMGGPISESIIRRKGLNKESDHIYVKEDSQSCNYMKGTGQLLLAMAIGVLVDKLLKLTGITFPTYFGALVAAALIRNCCARGRFEHVLDMGSIMEIGKLSLAFFLGMAMISLRLWELSGLAFTLVVILSGQVLFMWLYARYVAFPLLGRDYDAAVLVGGLVGFGLGATPNAMANMSAVCSKYSYAVRPFIIVPLIGALFVDILNTTIISVFLSLIQ